MKAKQWRNEFHPDPDPTGLKHPWDDEPDKKQWEDEATGLPCLIVRNRLGTLCGYVGVSEGHPHFDSEDAYAIDVNVHGGITFGDFCEPAGAEKPERFICHVVEDGENDRVYWLGFDCGHAWDLSPFEILRRAPRTFPDASYKSVEYVERECQRLAAQLAEMQS